jgi:membrane protein DedA with SNARE-associated domain
VRQQQFFCTADVDSMVTSQNLQRLRQRAPQIIFAAVVIAAAAYLLFEILEDVLVEGAPLTGGPLLWLWDAIISVTRNVTGAISSWGYVGIFTLMLLESTSLPVPSEVVLPFAGYLVSLGQMSFWATLALATGAGIAGSLVDYYIGLRGGDFLKKRRILGRVLFSMDQLNVVANWFNRYGAVTVFLSRLIPGFRTLISFPAGAVKMSLPKFAAYTAVGCLLWNGLLIYSGYFLGSSWKQVAGVSHYIIIGIAVVLVVSFVGFLLWRRRRAKRCQKAEF